MQGVDDAMRSVLRSGAQMEHRKNLGAGVDDQPQPEDLCGAAQPGSEFVQLQVREGQVDTQRSWKSAACLPARVSQVVMVACR